MGHGPAARPRRARRTQPRRHRVRPGRRALALGIHGLIRATQDIDLFIRPTEGNVARTRSALRSVFDDSSIDDILGEDLAGGYPVVRYLPPEADFVIDLMGRVGDAFTYDDLEAETRVLDGLSVRVAARCST